MSTGRLTRTRSHSAAVGGHQASGAERAIQRAAADGAAADGTDGTAPSLARAGFTINGSPPTAVPRHRRRRPPILEGRGYHTPDMVRPRGGDASPDGFALEGGQVSPTERPLDQLSLLPLKLGKNRGSRSQHAPLRSRPSSGSITNLQLADASDDGLAQLHRAHSVGMGPVRRLDMPETQLSPVPPAPHTLSSPTLSRRHAP